MRGSWRQGGGEPLAWSGGGVPGTEAVGCQAPHGTTWQLVPQSAQVGATRSPRCARAARPARPWPRGVRFQLVPEVPAKPDASQLLPLTQRPRRRAASGSAGPIAAVGVLSTQEPDPSAETPLWGVSGGISVTQLCEARAHQRRVGLLVLWVLTVTAPPVRRHRRVIGHEQMPPQTMVLPPNCSGLRGFQACVPCPSVLLRGLPRGLGEAPALGPTEFSPDKWKMR